MRTWIIRHRCRATHPSVFNSYKVARETLRGWQIARLCRPACTIGRER